MKEILDFLRALGPDFSLTAVIALLLLLGAPRVWTWFTAIYFPARQRLEEMRLAAEQERDKNDSATLITIRDTMMEIKTFMSLLSKKLLPQEEQK